MHKVVIEKGWSLKVEIKAQKIKILIDKYFNN